MVKKLIRITMASLVSGGVLVGLTKLGFKLNILNTISQWNICMVLGIVLITILNLQILTEKERKAI